MAQTNITDEDPLVAGLKQDTLAGAVLLRGWVSRSGNDKWRLFPEVSLGAYVEFLDADVVHSYRMDADRGTLVWLKAEAVITEVRPGLAEDLAAPAAPAVASAAPAHAPAPASPAGAPLAAGGWGGGSGGWGGGIPSPDPCKGVPSVSGRSCCSWLC